MSLASRVLKTDQEITQNNFFDWQRCFVSWVNVYKFVKINWNIFWIFEHFMLK